MDRYRGYTDINTADSADDINNDASVNKGAKESAAVTFIKELPVLVLVALVVAWLIKSFIVQPFYIPSGSMEPTFTLGDHVLVNKFLYRFGEPEPGDIIVFEYPLDPSKDYIKRIIALPGQKIEIKDSRIFIDGKEKKEKYISDSLIMGDFGPITVPANKYFVMGDNRNNSEDSRVWGSVPKKNILGKAFLIYWPPGRVILIK